MIRSTRDVHIPMGSSYEDIADAFDQSGVNDWILVQSWRDRDQDMLVLRFSAEH